MDNKSPSICLLLLFSYAAILKQNLDINQLIALSFTDTFFSFPFSFLFWEMFCQDLAQLSSNSF